MRRGVCVALAIAAVLASYMVSVGGSHAHLWTSPTKEACVSTDCGPWAVTLNWTIPAFPNQTGYWLFLNGTQEGASTTSPFTFTGSDCGASVTLGVEAHDGSGNHGPLWTTSYSAPACPVQTTAFSDTFGGSSIAQGPNQWTVVTNTLDNTNTYDCAEAANSAETGGNLVETLSSGSYTCPGPVGGNSGITSCPGGTCSASWAGGTIHARDQAFQYGTVTYSAKIAGSTSANNAWPTIWLLGDYCQHPQYIVDGNDAVPCNWHSTGSEEIDISEWFNGASPTTGMDANEFDNTTSGPSCFNQNTTDASTNFHTYELDWSAGSMTMKIDGSTVCTYSNPDVPTSVMFPIISTYMGGTSSCGSCHTYVKNFSVTPAGPNITSTANWPSISGSLAHGSTLTAATGTWTGSPSSYNYQWMLCNSSGGSCSWITSGSSCSSTPFTCTSTYTTTSGEVGDTIEVLVQANNGSGETVFASNVTGAIT